MHNTVERSFALACRDIGVDILFPDKSFEGIIKYGLKYETLPSDMPENASTVSYEELIANEFDDDLVIMITCYEVQHDVLELRHKMSGKYKLLFYSGNDNTYHFYDKRFCKNIIAADIDSYVKAKVDNINCIGYYPYVDYETFSYEGYSDSNTIRTFIHSYNKLFPESYEIASKAMENFPGIEWEVIDGKPKHETISLMNDMIANLHVKRLEGYGFAIIESLARGRPCILYRPFSNNRSYTNWCIDGVNSIYFTSYQEFTEKVSKYLLDEEARHKMQDEAASVIRRVINNERENEKLKKILENLV